MNPQRLQAILSGDDRTLSARASRVGLSILEPGYRLGMALRNALYDAGLRKVIRLPRPVISVGNLTTGGTGKTPMVAALARRLIERGIRPAILMRGYKSGLSGSDEAAILREELGASIPIIAQPDRVAAAHEVLREHSDVGVFVLDDGFQHRRVHRDLNLVLIDATNPFGFGRVLPRGLLREPAGNLRRTDALIVTRADEIDGKALVELDRQIAVLSGKPPIAHAVHAWKNLRDAGSREHPINILHGKKVLALCGIGNPASFLHAVRRHAGAEPIVRVFDDHHHYTVADLAWVIQETKHQCADAIVMTEKDWVKWRGLSPSPSSQTLFRPQVELTMREGWAALDELCVSCCP